MCEKIKSLKAYQDKWFIYINNYLRYTTNTTNTDDKNFLLNHSYYTEEILNDTKTHIKNLDDLFTEANKIEANKIDNMVVVYRGSEYMNEGIYPTFISTSKCLSVAKKYAQNKYLYELHLNKNIPFIDIDTWESNEKEILLPRKLNLTIKKIINKKHYIMDVNLLD